MMRQMRCIVAAAAMAAWFGAVPAAADQWNDKVELTFSSPVMVPGATLQPGTYIFTLADIRGARHLVQIRNAQDTEVIAMTQAVPVRRDDPRGDAVLTFNITDSGVPAVKAWYHPSSSYGHQFVYPEDQARQIAERSKTIVLSTDVPGTDLAQGTLRVYHPTGTRSEWHGDADTARAWDKWQRDRAVLMGTSDSAQNGSGPHDGNGDADHGRSGEESRAPMMASTGGAMKIALDDLESSPAKFYGKTVTVDAEVETIHGPRLFTIDEPAWADLEREVLVYAPSVLAALVREDDKVTVTGTVTPVAMAEIERDWGWLGLDSDLEVTFMKKPVLVASTIVGGDNDVAMFIAADPDTRDTAEPVDASDEAANTGRDDRSGDAAPMMDLGTIAQGTADLVGRQVHVRNVRVLRPAQGGGFFADAPGGAVFVLPAHTVPVTVAAGDVVEIRGAIARMPEGTEKRVSAPSGWNDRIYVLATAVSK